MANAYVTLANSNASLSKRFKAQSIRLVTSKSQNMDRTIGGGLDVTEGGIYSIVRMTLVVPYASTDVNYGTYANLLTLYSLNNPTATPSNVITFIDYFGTTHTCHFAGDLDAEPADPPTCDLDGNYSFYIIPVELRIIPTGDATT